MNNHLIGEKAAIVEALDALNRLSGAPMTLFVVDGAGNLAGSLTDGDIRRALLNGSDLNQPVGAICNRDCLMIERSRRDVAVISRARAKGIRLIPVVDGGKIISFIDLGKQRGLVPADAVLMAGGMGERLRPLTFSTPKPLLPVGKRPIIDHNIDLLHSFGIENIFVTVNYLKEQIIDHFRENHDNVKCVEEPCRLGTMGSLSLVEGLTAPHVIVMNADLLTDINLEALYLKHIETEAVLTMAVVPYTVSVPFAIVKHTADCVEGLEEKPTYNYLANAGIYILCRELAQSLPKGERLDAPELIEKLISEGKRVSLYAVDGKWIDIGSPDDYRHANAVTN